MIGTFKEFLEFVGKFFTWWVSIQPWEQGLRVRAGKHESRLKPGLHFKVPILDLVYVQTDRQRVISVPIQTLTTKDGKTITVNIALRYSIKDISLLYHSFYHPEVTLSNMAMGGVAKFVAINNLDNCGPTEIERDFKLTDFENKGLKDIAIVVIGYAIVRTYRLIQEGGYMDTGMRLDKDSAIK